MQRTAKTFILSLMLATLLAVAPDVTAAELAITSNVDSSALPEKKQTRLNLYITAKEAASLIRGRKDVILIDVRTPEETMFVGYPNAANVNIPFKLVDPAHKFDVKKGSYKLIPNRDFVATILTFMKAPAGKSAKTLLVMCRSGNRSAQAVNTLAEQGGFSNAYSVVDGFEGDKDNKGKRTINGWKNSGASWTTTVREDYWFRSQ